MRSVRYGFIQPIQQSTSLMLNDNIPYTPLLRSSKGLRKKSKKLYPMVLAILFIKRVRKCIKKRKMREKILEQWYMTENSYYLDLWIMANWIKKPLQDLGIINFQQSLILFPQIEAMIQLSQMMISVLSRALKTDQPYKIAVCKQMVNFVNGYKIYGSYFNSHHQSSNLLQQLSTSHELQMKQIESRMQQQFAIRQSKKQSLTLKDCMQQPFYRLFKYDLLVKEYSKKLPKFHPDYEWAINCHNCFRQINNYYNELMKNVEEKQKKNKLHNLFGSILYEQSVFVSQVQASTTLYEVKVYVFNHIVIVTKISTHLGCQKQEKYGYYELNQFSYIGFQDNMKYFKYGLILIGKTKCLHLYFSDDPIRLEFYRCILKIIKQIRLIKHQQRIMFNRLSLSKSEVSTERSSSQMQKRNFGFPQFHIEIVGCQTRPMGNLSNSIIYEIRVMIPFYYEDQINLSKSSETIKQKQHLKNSFSSQNSYKNKQEQKENKKISLFEDEDGGSEENSDKRLKNSIFKCVNQRIFLSFEQIQQIYNQLKKIYPNLPDIDPPINEGSYSAKGKRKTKSHETRKVFIQQFFNFSFRNSSILNSPIWLLSKLRINSDIWNYATERNFRLASFNIKELANINYGFDHCLLCSQANINTIKQFQALRKQYTQKGSLKTKKLYCQNFFNLLRMKLLSLDHQNFNSSESVLLYYHYLEGRIDYPFFQHHCNDKINKIIRIYHLCVDDRYQQIQIDSKTTVGQVIDHMAYLYDMKNSFDFDLMVEHEKKAYILDRDQFLGNIIKNLQIKSTQCQPEASREKLRSSKSKNGLLNTIKSWGSKIFQSEQELTKIYFAKSTYLLKSLEMKSFNSYTKKKQLQVERIFWMIKKGKLGLSQKQLFQLGAIFYCLRQYNSIQSFSYENMSSKLISKIISDEFSHLFQYKQEFKRKFSDSILFEREMLYKNQKKKEYLYHKVLELVSQKLGYKTYYIDAEAKQLPQNFASRMQITGNYKLGINNKNLIIKKDASIVCLFPIEQIEFDISVYSIYIIYQKWSFRFDGKMIFRFGEMAKKYKTILYKFPDHVAENIIL